MADDNKTTGIPGQSEIKAKVSISLSGMLFTII